VVLFSSYQPTKPHTKGGGRRGRGGERENNAKGRVKKEGKKKGQEVGRKARTTRVRKKGK
jgi:hypothetical protein